MLPINSKATRLIDHLKTEEKEKRIEREGKRERKRMILKVFRHCPLVFLVKLGCKPGGWKHDVNTNIHLNYT